MEATQDHRLARMRERAETARSHRRGRRAAAILAALGLVAVALLLEVVTSTVQSLALHRVAAGLSFGVEPGPSDRIRFPESGPFDLRRGDALIPQFTDSMAARGYRITEQARMSPRMLVLMDHGLYPTYPEKTQAGLSILDRQGRPIYVASFPERVYRSYDEIPPVIVRSLLYLENRSLLHEGSPHHNPAVEWDRLAKASMDFLLNHVGFHRPQAGGSTLATQIEKFRHSKEGRTDSPAEKLKQMLAASLRAYRDGRTTSDARRQIILDYVNSVPLSARPEYGEVQGLQDGLWVWYGADPTEVNRLLADGGPGAAAERGCAYREVLSLFIAQRRPSEFLLTDRPAFEAEVDRNLRFLSKAGMIPADLGEAALRARLRFRTTPPTRLRPSFAEMKATNAIRTRLLGLTHLPSFYDLDRLDLTVESTIDRETQQRVTRTLRRLGDPAFTDSLGLRGERLLSRGDPAGVIYSFNLYERVSGGNVLRVQADNLDRPLDINEGVKLELGSTAKLRTLCNYLMIVADLHAQWAGKSRQEILLAAADADDPIRTWAYDYLASAPDSLLSSMLKAAVNREYSGNPGEAFYTGGGLHTFQNFEKDEDRRFYTVRDGLVYSVNLVYIRLMRDIVRYYRAEVPAYSAGILDEPDNPARQGYLERFADKEGRQFLWGFYTKYRGKSPDDRLRALVSRIEPTPKRLAVIYRSARPAAAFDDFVTFMRWACRRSPHPPEMERKLFDDYAPEKFSLSDRGYLARVHPLELWLLAYLETHPEARWDEIAQASVDRRQEVYSWLFKGRRKAAQDKRIRDILDEEAFQHIHEAWRKLGYPFNQLVPSYATAIGSSADKPAALADLMGILVNDGCRYPLRRLERLRFAEGTPFETVLEPGETAGQRVMPAEVARIVRSALIDAVEKGTARRAANAFKLANGTIVPIGGKTGTGDNRYDTWAPGGRLISSKVVNRTATFVFLIGDQFFGTVTAHVSGPGAADYVFTSALPAQLLKSLAPDLMPLLSRSYGHGVSPVASSWTGSLLFGEKAAVLKAGPLDVSGVSAFVPDLSPSWLASQSPRSTGMGSPAPRDRNPS